MHSTKFWFHLQLLGLNAREDSTRKNFASFTMEEGWVIEGLLCQSFGNQDPNKDEAQFSQSQKMRTAHCSALPPRGRMRDKCCFL